LRQEEIRKIVISSLSQLIMSTKLFIGGLAWAVTDESLREAFEEAGVVVSATVIVDRATGRSKGFGFVEMESEEAAQAAIDMWHEKEIEGRRVIVNEARPRESQY
jgi:RNA recognition motif-containing protein